MIYSIRLTGRAERELAALDASIAERLVRRLRWLAGNADEVRHERLTGPLAPAFKIRAGDFRAIYTLDRAAGEIVVHRLGHRSTVYKD